MLQNEQVFMSSVVFEFPEIKIDTCTNEKRKQYKIVLQVNISYCAAKLVLFQCCEKGFETVKNFFNFQVFNLIP